MKWLLSIASALALLIASLQWNVLSKLRAENQALRATSEAAKADVRSPEAELLHQQDEELARLREETKSLARNRNDIRLLRQQKPELDKLRAVNQQLLAANQAGTNPPGASYITSAALKDAGLFTPETTCQTLFFAMRGGDVKRLFDCLAPDAKERSEFAKGSGEELAQLSRQLSEQFKKFPGFLVVNQSSTSADQVELGIQCAPGGEVIKIRLRLYGNEWKVLHFP